MVSPSPFRLTSDPFSIERLRTLWRELNTRYFRGALLPIEITWSRRLTSSAGMFASRGGPRARRTGTAGSTHRDRLIRLSVPLLQHPSADGRHAERELIGTLAHEMIHQWQFDRLKRRPNHGPDFYRLMAIMNRDGLGVTVRHPLDDAVRALAKYAWRCRQCGRIYERQRRTIRPSRHRCGACRGSLREVDPTSVERPPSKVLPPELFGRDAVRREDVMTLDVSAWERGAGNALQVNLPFPIP